MTSKGVPVKTILSDEYIEKKLALERIPLVCVKTLCLETLDPNIRIHREALCALASLIDSIFFDVLELTSQEKIQKASGSMIMKEDIARSFINDVSLHARFVKNNPQACRLLQMQEDASVSGERKKKREKPKKETGIDVREESEQEQKKERRVGPKRTAKSRAEQEIKENVLMQEESDEEDDDEYIQEKEEEDEDEEEDDEESESDRSFIVDS